jgi:acylpyruvate hydrolase
MKLITVRLEGSTRAGRVEGDEVVLLDGADVKAVLESADGLGQAASADGPRIALADADLAPVVPRPDKTVCIGRNYHAHMAEMGNPPPPHPIYFTKYARSLVGPRDDIELPGVDVSAQVDWEGELVAIIGRSVRNASAAEALEAVAGFTVGNDVSMRDWQTRTSQYLAGKAWDSATPIGPALVTRDEVGDGSGLALVTEVDGVVKQEANTDEMVFSTIELVQDLSRIVTLDPGDLILTGTPGGVGHARQPPEYLVDGTVVRVSIEGVGEIVNRCVEKPA